MGMWSDQHDCGWSKGELYAVSVNGEIYTRDDAEWVDMFRQWRQKHNYYD